MGKAGGEDAPEEREAEGPDGGCVEHHAVHGGFFGKGDWKAWPNKLGGDKSPKHAEEERANEAQRHTASSQQVGEVARDSGHNHHHQQAGQVVNCERERHGSFVRPKAAITELQL